MKTMTKSEFNNISWPKEFYVEFVDGEKQLFVSEQGITWDSGANESDEDKNRANISCCWQKKSKSQQSFRSVNFWVDEIQNIESKDGTGYGQKIHKKVIKRNAKRPRPFMQSVMSASKGNLEWIRKTQLN